MSEKEKFTKLTKDEAGKLHGGYSIRPFVVEANNRSSNVNCTYNGPDDKNYNCKCSCGSNHGNL